MKIKVRIWTCERKLFSDFMSEFMFLRVGYLFRGKRHIPVRSVLKLNCEFKLDIDENYNC